MIVSDYELLRMLPPTLRRRLISLNSPVGTFEPVGVSKDYWSLYLYGKTAKIVYFKRGVPNPQPKQCNVVATSVSEKDTDERFASSLKRTKSNVFELAICNEFEYFATLTLDETKRDRYDLSAFRTALAQYIRNQNRGREDKILYLCIPEHHKNGAWHIHGLFKGLTASDLTKFTLRDNIPLRFKRAIRNGEKIYNWVGYAQRFGYCTLTPIKSVEGCSKYVTKYITKDLLLQSRESGSRLFFASQGLKRRECVVRNEFDVCPISDWDYENEYVKIKTIKL